MDWVIAIALVVIVTAIIVFKKKAGNAISGDTRSTYRSHNREVSSDTDAHRHYPVAVVGESHSNSDGMPRQSIIAMCRAGDAVRLVPEPGNRHDPNAVKVIYPAGQIGYVPSESAPRIRDDINSGRIIGAEILRVQGPAGRCGVSLEITAINGRIKKQKA